MQPYSQLDLDHCSSIDDVVLKLDNVLLENHALVLDPILEDIFLDSIQQNRLKAPIRQYLLHLKTEDFLQKPFLMQLSELVFVKDQPIKNKLELRYWENHLTNLKSPTNLHQLICINYNAAIILSQKHVSLKSWQVLSENVDLFSLFPEIVAEHLKRKTSSVTIHYLYQELFKKIQTAEEFTITSELSNLFIQLFTQNTYSLSTKLSPIKYLLQAKDNSKAQERLYNLLYHIDPQKVPFELLDYILDKTPPKELWQFGKLSEYAKDSLPRLLLTYNLLTNYSTLHNDNCLNNEIWQDMVKKIINHKSYRELLKGSNLHFMKFKNDHKDLSAHAKIINRVIQIVNGQSLQ